MLTHGRFFIICILQIYTELLSSKEHCCSHSCDLLDERFWSLQRYRQTKYRSSLVWPWNLWISSTEGPYAIEAAINGTSGWLLEDKSKCQFRESETLPLAQALAEGHWGWHTVPATSLLSQGCAHELPIQQPELFLSFIVNNTEKLYVHTSLNRLFKKVFWFFIQCQLLRRTQ